jgi:hypothetical protein
MAFWTNVKGWQKLVLLLVVILIVTSIASPSTAEWILAPIMELARTGLQLVREIGGTS